MNRAMPAAAQLALSVVWAVHECRFLNSVGQGVHEPKAKPQLTQPASQAAFSGVPKRVAAAERAAPVEPPSDPRFGPISVRESYNVRTELA